jgi:hypothetical protein
MLAHTAFSFAMSPEQTIAFIGGAIYRLLRLGRLSSVALGAV